MSLKKISGSTFPKNVSNTLKGIREEFKGKERRSFGKITAELNI